MSTGEDCGSGTRVKIEGPDGSDRQAIRSSTMASVGEGKPERKGRIAVLASGRGSDFQAIVDSIESGEVTYEISILICNNPDAFAIHRAKKHGIPYVLIDHRGKDREVFDMEINDVLKETDTNIVVLAGFMRILSEKFVEMWRDRIINIHPALLPSFPGAHAHRDALEYGVKVTGLTIHFVDENMDAGPIIFQHPVEVMDDDNEESLSMRVLEMEHKWYPVIIDRVVRGLYVRQGRIVRQIGE
jgi:phosphoribosylglycinamide formyltransferase-1